MIYFHGTNADAAKRILREGFKANEGGNVWTCSGNATYFWSPKELEKWDECEEGDGEHKARANAFDSSICSLARAKDCRSVVFEVEIKKTVAVEPDESCPDMSGAVCVTDNIPRSAIRRVWISDDLSLLKGYFLAGMANRNLANIYLSPVELKVTEVMEKAEIYPEDIEEIAALCEFPPKVARELLK